MLESCVTFLLWREFGEPIAPKLSYPRLCAPLSVATNNPPNSSVDSATRRAARSALAAPPWLPTLLHARNSSDDALSLSLSRLAHRLPPLLSCPLLSPVCPSSLIMPLNVTPSEKQELLVTMAALVLHDSKVRQHNRTHSPLVHSLRSSLLYSIALDSIVRSCGSTLERH